MEKERGAATSAERQRRGETRGGRRVSGDYRGAKQLQEQPAAAQHPEHGAAVREQTREGDRNQEKDCVGPRTQNGEDSRHHHGNLHPLLAALLHRRPNHALLPGVVLHATLAKGRHQLAGLLQLFTQPHHLRLFQQRFPERLQENHQVSFLQTVMGEREALKIKQAAS